MSLAYLAGPIDAATHEQAHNWRQTMADMLAKNGISCYNPYGAIMTNPGIMQDVAGKVIGINEVAIRFSDYTIFNLLQSGLPAIGTIRELELSVRLGKKTIVMVPHGTNSLALHDVSKVCHDFITAADWVVWHHMGMPS